MIRCKAVHDENGNSERSLYANPNLLIPHKLSNCEYLCDGCGARHYKEEATKDELKKVTRVYTSCCQKDKVTLPEMDEEAPKTPSLLIDLFTGESTRARNFQALTRLYNNSVSFTSLGASIDKSVRGQKGVDVFRISGGLSHLVASVEPVNETNPGFAQIYVVGQAGEEDTLLRIRKANGKKDVSKAKVVLREDIVSDLVLLMYSVNPYAKLFKNARTLLKGQPSKTLALTTIYKAGTDHKRYNNPTPEEIGIVVNGEGNIDKTRQIRLQRKDGGLEYISDLHSSYFPLRYPIFFPYGSQQWDNHYRANTSRALNRAVGSLEWFAFLLFDREGHFSPILHGRALLQEFIVDSYVCVERRRLGYIVNNQTKLKASQYNSLMKSLENEIVPEGRRVILPSTFIGSPRAMGQLYQDSMAICGVHGPPSLFITMTANPTWDEVLKEIGTSEQTYDHPTIVARIFYLKVKSLLVEIVEGGRLGRVIAYVWVIEFQKRGLPHLHLMVTLDEKDRPDTPEKVDLLVCAELPDPEEEPDLYEVISKTMIHGPCRGRPCWKKDGCSYGYPKPYTPRTVTISGAYPVYRRRRSEVTAVKNRITFDSSSVVPYNKYLALMFKCHINVEIPIGGGRALNFKAWSWSRFLVERDQGPGIEH
ncbi:hypothetical protein MJO29_015884 [Puccinia striiformis f. sp. tritici]|nr:hypothetical protein MJO29_015884 [Puccinia striiformis f. sp. tritici]